MPKGPWVLVIGSHRSGTSALTGGMGALGLALPRDEDRLDWLESNPDHFESVRMLLFDERMLKSLGGNWERPPEIPDAWADSAAARGFDADAAVAAARAFPGSGPLVWKDPRACLLLPYWKRRIDGPLAVVFIWRDPLAVARSLAARNGFNLFHGVALWEHYNLAALHSLKGMEVLATSYEALAERPQDVYGQIAAWLDSLDQLAPWRGSWDVDRATATMDTQFRHQLGDPMWPYLESQRQLLDVLGGLDGVHRSFDPGPLPTASPWASGLLEMAGRVTAERELKEVYTSSSWKVTKPLRYVFSTGEGRGKREQAARRAVRDQARSARSLLGRAKLRLLQVRWAIQCRVSRRPVTGTADVVVSMTSHGWRLGRAHHALESIARGDVRPARMILWISDEFEKRPLQGNLRRLQQRGLEIRFYRDDIGPHMKYYPYAVSEVTHRVPLVTADDDIRYSADWLRGLLEARSPDPSVICAYVSRRLEFSGDDFVPWLSMPMVDSTVPDQHNAVLGFGGVLYPPEFIDALREAGERFRGCTPMNDDIWLTYMAVITGFLVRQVRSEPVWPQRLPWEGKLALRRSNLKGGNDEQLTRTFGPAPRLCFTSETSKNLPTKATEVDSEGSQQPVSNGTGDDESHIHLRTAP